jgi:hypothetical protein
LYRKILRRHPEVLAALGGEPRRMGHKRLRPSFETPRKRAAPQDDGGDWFGDFVVDDVVRIGAHHTLFPPGKRHRRPQIASREGEFQGTSLSIRREGGGTPKGAPW